MFKPVEIQATAKQGRWLKQLPRSSRERHRLVEGAQLLVYSLSQGNVSNLKGEVALGVGQVYIKQWRKRWAQTQAALAHQQATLSEKDYEQALQHLLEDASVAGPLFNTRKNNNVSCMACQSPLGYPLRHWDSKSLGLELIKQGMGSDIAVSRLSRFWTYIVEYLAPQRGDLKPHQSQYWLHPQYEDEAKFVQQTQVICQL